MADGKWKKIEEIEPGDLVLSAHEHDPEGRVEAKTVLEVYHHEPRPIVEVEIQGGVIRCTPKHPFYVRDHGWTAAEDLPPAAQFRTREGTWTALKKKRITQTTEPVFNFAVEENHTYFVGNGNETAILVHNDSGKVAKTILEVYAKVRLIGTGSAEFVLKNGEKIVIRNAKFIETWITTKELAIFTNVDLHTLKEVEKKFPKIKVFYDKMGQPIFPKECIKYTVDKLTPKELIGDYAKIALDSLELKDPELYKRLINEGIGRYVWHHAGDGSLQLIDKDVHRAFQHTGLKSVLKKSLLTPLVLAGLLIPGTEQFANGDVNGGCREFTIAFTPLVWSEVGAAGLEVFYDELQRELEEGDMGVNKPATPEQMNRLNDQIQYGPHGYGLDIDLGYGT
jgi:hypothetical protein